MFDVKRHLVFDKLETLRLQGEEKGLDWVMEQIEQWMVQLDNEEKAVNKYLEEEHAKGQ
jgi:hypothetical protein